MKKLWRNNVYFFIPYILIVLICSILLLTFSKPEIHIFINKANTPFFDIFFKYATFFGDGATIVILSLVLLFVRFRYAFAFLAGSLISSLLVVNLFKKVLLHEIYRPSKYFELFETYKLHLVEGVKMHSMQSFPSGHTATAFNVFLMLALLTKNNLLKFVMFCLAVIVGFSRVYLSQHFLIDIAAGSVLGVVFIALSWVWFENRKTDWLDKSILTAFKKK